MAPNHSLSPKSKSKKVEEESSAGASNFMNKASDDLLLEIFVRIPDCRTATQSKSVSKHWCSLISSPQYVRNFIHHRHIPSNLNNRPPQQLLEHSASPPYTFLIQGSERDRSAIADHQDCDQHRYCSKFYQIFSEKSRLLHSRSSVLSIRDYLSFLPEPTVVAASYDDLLLVTPSPRSSCYYLCNPLTRKWMALPAALDRRAAPSGVGLVCQPNNCVDKQLGCSTNAEYKFKVVRFYCYPLQKPPFYDNVRLIASTFCSETRKWSDSAISIVAIQSVPNSTIWCYSPVIACNGILYWLNDMFSGKLVAFDPFFNNGTDQDDEKRWRFIKTPTIFHPINPMTDKGGDFFLGVCDGVRLRVALFAWYSPRVLEVWELDGNDSWCQVHEVLIRRRSKHIVLSFKPNNGDVILLYSQDNHVYEYNIKEKKLERVSEIHSDQTSEERLDCVKYVYSVFPLVHPPWPTPIPALPSV